ncbi:N-formylglutamate amidohydrolase [Christiangramia sp. SM2212]|uniref:N-formylglutamate amidohydrolase n=2 Tax=Christiangramia sediminicola TaxID=3073267 RepID=A0ABU1EP76_9FLAO|nr:N-formylglutamate amidohydrolase [Christiangramia sp. SM2212]
MKFLLTCEHAFSDIPKFYQELFKFDNHVLETHEAFDPGAFDLFKYLEPLADFSKYQRVGRLLIETNRSLHHPKLFSRFSQDLKNEDKQFLIQKLYQPYRDEIEKKIASWLKNGEKIIHISVHSFTPILNEIERNCDIGLLYDPARIREKEFCSEWKKKMKLINLGYSVRFNYPYLGKADGFTTYLRKKFGTEYCGIELEINQKWANENKMNLDLKNLVFESLKISK